MHVLLYCTGGMVRWQVIRVLIWESRCILRVLSTMSWSTGCLYTYIRIQAFVPYTCGVLVNGIDRWFRGSLLHLRRLYTVPDLYAVSVSRSVNNSPVHECRLQSVHCIECTVKIPRLQAGCTALIPLHTAAGRGAWATGRGGARVRALTFTRIHQWCQRF